MDLLAKKWWLGRFRPYSVKNGQPYHAPGLEYGEYGSRITFRDRLGGIRFIEIDEGIMYVCTPGYTSKQRFPAACATIIKTFNATESKTESEFQPLGCQFNSITIKNNLATTVDVKVRQTATNYLVGSGSYYFTIPASKAICISTFANPQFIDDANPQDTVVEIDGTGDITVIGLFTKLL